jgi:hypothetical protein
VAGHDYALWRIGFYSWVGLHSMGGVESVIELEHKSTDTVNEPHGNLLLDFCYFSITKSAYQKLRLLQPICIADLIFLPEISDNKSGYPYT